MASYVMPFGTMLVLIGSVVNFQRVEPPLFLTLSYKGVSATP